MASTKLPENEWAAKEYDEQQIVTDFILECFTDIENVKVNGPETIQAGKFQHLKSYISGNVSSDFPIEKLLKKLHPTPALCGMPKKKLLIILLKMKGIQESFILDILELKVLKRKNIL